MSAPWFDNAYFITGTAYAGKSTMVRMLAERHHGIACGENYHEELMAGLDARQFPCLCYTRDLEDWGDFIRRTPGEYEAWYDGVSKECEILELRLLPDICKRGGPVFVDTNISLETLKKIAPHGHVLVMLADPAVSVNRFFERPDREKQFLYRLIMQEPDPAAAMENYRRGLERINSRERYQGFLHSGFNVILRDEARSVSQTLTLAQKAFGLSAQTEQNSKGESKMITVYTSPLCPDCRECRQNFLAHGVEYSAVDITESMRNLKEFLRLRDSSPVFDPCRAAGSVGIPAIVGDDGSVTLDWEGWLAERGLGVVYREERPGAACSVDGSGC